MMDESIREYLAKPYSRVLIPDPEGGFTAEVLEWPGCLGEGETADEAMASLEQSMIAWLDSMLSEGRTIPEPIAKEYSGRLVLRLARNLHRRLALRAAAEGVSQNQYIVGALEARLAGADVDPRMSKSNLGALLAASEQMLTGLPMSYVTNVSAATPDSVCLVKQGLPSSFGETTLQFGVISRPVDRSKQAAANTGANDG